MIALILKLAFSTMVMWALGIVFSRFAWMNKPPTSRALLITLVAYAVATIGHAALAVALGPRANFIGQLSRALILYIPSALFLIFWLRNRFKDTWIGDINKADIFE